jgi:phospholipid-binding lipoprotein MlaA
MKVVCFVFFLSALFLICVSGPCAGSSEVLSSLASSGEPVSVDMAIESNEPLNQAETGISPVPEPPLRDLLDENPVRVVIANVQPESLGTGEQNETIVIIPDPLEPMNRAFFTFNDRLYFWVFKPVASGYKAVVPEKVRVSVRNFFSNVTTPVRLVNCLLQADVTCAGTETSRFFFNTTVGIVGFFDPAKNKWSLEKQDRDFGQTLGVWGMGPVIYFNWPILGPSDVRDTVGYVGDIFLDPRTYLFYRITAAAYGVWVLDKVNGTSLTIGEYEDLKESALDPYIAFRDAYVQYRQNKIGKIKNRQSKP